MAVTKTINFSVSVLEKLPTPERVLLLTKIKKTPTSECMLHQMV